jgi:transcriptional regulator with XRE-family HTH domain
MMNSDEKTKQALGKKLREVREAKSLSQEEAAKLSLISTTYYAGIERGEENPSILVIKNICKALKVKSSYVLPF